MFKLTCSERLTLSIYLYILPQPCKEDIGTGSQRHRAKKKERIKSKIGKVKKLKVMLQKRIKTVNNEKKDNKQCLSDTPPLVNEEN